MPEEHQDAGRVEPGATDDRGSGSSTVTSTATTLPLMRLAQDQVPHSSIQTRTSHTSNGNW